MTARGLESGAGGIASTLAWLAVGAAAGTVIAILANPEERARALERAGRVHALGSGARAETETASGRARRRRDRKKDLTVREPRGARWEELTRAGLPDADELPRAFAENPETSRYWESIPVHVREDDAFARCEGMVEAIVATRRLPTAQLEQIMRDTPRTFPEDSFFADTDVQDTMRRVLTAAALEFPDVGYVQSMNFIVGFLMLHAKTEDAVFCLFRRIMTHPRLAMRRVYAKGLPMLIALVDALSALLLKHLPAVAVHLRDRARVDVLLFAQNWIMTIFTYSMPWETASNVWEAFLERGWEAVLLVALELVAECDETSRLTALDFEGAFNALRDAATNAPEDVWDRARARFTLDEEDRALVRSAVEVSAAPAHAAGA